MNVDQQTITEIASRHNIPPAIVYALTQASTLSGVRPSTSQDLEKTVETIADDYLKYGSWEEAVSAYVSGDPTAFQSPTSPAGGAVNAILGIASARPDYGTAGFRPELIGRFNQLAAGFGRTIQNNAKLGGVVTPQHVAQWSGYSQGLRDQHTQAQSAIGHGISSDPSKIPFQSFDAMPFDAKFLADQTEAFGDTSGPGGYHEVGNDYGLHFDPVKAPMGGVIEVRDMGRMGTGLTAYIKLDNGWRIGLGHMRDLGVKVGQRVNAGDLIGTSGGAAGDAHGGNTTGPHIEFQLIDPSGQFHDPYPLLQATAKSNHQPKAPEQQREEKGQSPPWQSGVPQHFSEGKGGGEPTPAQVGRFASQLQGHSITPEHFIQLYPHVASMRRRMLNQGTKVDDFAPHTGQTPDQALTSIRAMPHPMYPHLQAGPVSDAYDVAALHSTRMPENPRMPQLSEAARFAAGGMKHDDIGKYYEAFGKML